LLLLFSCTAIHLAPQPANTTAIYRPVRTASGAEKTDANSQEQAAVLHNLPFAFSPGALVVIHRKLERGAAGALGATLGEMKFP
jgi:hypothetical protein